MNFRLQFFIRDKALIKEESYTSYHVYKSVLDLHACKASLSGSVIGECHEH